MDWNKLQHTLFSLDPTDPKEDLAKMRAAAQGSNTAPAVESVDYLNESVKVPQGSLEMDRNYSVSDFAALAGVIINESQKTGPAGQAKGKDPMPKAEPGRTKHPLKDKLVGEAEEDRITALERRIEALESMLSERELTKPETKEKERIVKGMKKNKSDFKDRYGKDADAVMYATATKNAKTNESVNSIKSQLWAALKESK
jgi:hypothetical protein